MDMDSWAWVDYLRKESSLPQITSNLLLQIFCQGMAAMQAVAALPIEGRLPLKV